MRLAQALAKKKRKKIDLVAGTRLQMQEVEGKLGRQKGLR
jgi:hypothetical protein